MKPKFDIFLFLSMFFTISFVESQELNSPVNSLYLVSKDLIYVGNNEIGQVQQSSNIQLLSNNNLIHISQIGFNNYSDISVHNENSTIVIGQYGLNNYVSVDKNAYDLTQLVTQYGNNNYVSDFSSYTSGSINMTINQEGNNLTLFNNGSNSISKDLKITQSGNSGAIYIFNH
ncbi:hypothetical protein [Flavobacterium petrolei]|uniref:hypothetical protein n=1 Tax=Flavobacterium petrolei TaxID=2259594 RepID=UPI003756DF99